jgi:hypothetical protein
METVPSSALALPCFVSTAKLAEGQLRLTFVESAQWSFFSDGAGNEGAIFHGKVYRFARDGIESKVMPEPESSLTFRAAATLQLSDTHRGCNLSVVERPGKNFLRGESGFTPPGGSGGQSQESLDPL